MIVIVLVAIGVGVAYGLFLRMKKKKQDSKKVSLFTENEEIDERIWWCELNLLNDYWN